MAGTAPMVLAATSDTLTVEFDPDGDIDIDVNNATLNLSADIGTVWANAWTNTTGGWLTLWNNGSIIMDTEIYTGNTVALTLDTAGTPETDEYSIYIEDLSLPGYLPAAAGTPFDNDLASNDYKYFDLCLLMGTNMSANHSWQSATVTFRGSVG